MRRAERVVAICCVFLGIAIFWQAWRMEYYTSLGPGPGFFPLWLGLLLTGLSLAWLVAALQRRPAEEPAKPFFPEWAGLRRILLIGGAVAGVGITMEIVGFQLAMFVFVVFVLTALGRRGWGLTVSIACIMSFGIYHTFTRWLDVTLPQATIEILRQWGF